MKTYLLVVLSCIFLSAHAQSDLALVGARIYPSPGAPPIEQGVVLIKNGKIAAVGSQQQVKVPTNLRVIDGKGLVLMAGFWNSHVHFMSPVWEHADSLPAAQLTAQLTEMLTSRGFTHAFDLATLNFRNLRALRDRVRSGEVDGPAILSAGEPFVPPNGSPFYVRPIKLPEISTPEAAVAYVKKQLDAGADAIKIWSASPVGNNNVVAMPVDIVKAATTTAHQYQKSVFAHPTSDTGMRVAVAGGVDILAHVSPDGYVAWKQADVDMLRQHHVAVIPTLKLYKWELERNKVASPEDHPLVKTAIEQIGIFAKAGGEILFGTDVGYISDFNTEDEFRFLAAAGLTFDQILTSLTTAPAKRFGLSQQCGRVVKGLDADLVLLKADPHTDIRNFAAVAYTIRKGKVIYDAQTSNK
ncbi:amidohydrolase family protein [Chitinophaga sp. G-6-1-13]|uniref:Amidohydrolase family protein n=1 Tax=Chitinophaga fulva TaxID=2728842 RepID=A0A848GQ91_9BACT|nr:amidohydrolase family protein [Chitinophaga fulva]NML39519.1 amidohydrolase family protein [Chitinophaga fulva]